ncbi:hypothetical protein BDZ89DRAFT_1072712 [Hymenopellis radicata]|nr:hypothetical protein BDZ89DRAFT_1072712 [Hymenopellis radicata]
MSLPSLLDTFPEELLERILYFCVVAAPDPQASRPSWQPQRRRAYTRLTPLLICKSFYRIALPHYYHTVHLTTPEQSSCLRTLLRRRTYLARSVRRLVVTCVASDTSPAMRLCTGLTALDVTLDPYADSESFCDTLETLEKMTCFTLRKQHNIYLTMPSVRRFMTRIAATIASWPRLESANLAFRLSDDDGPVSGIAQALSFAPSLRSFSTEVPSLWNEAILRISHNPKLEKIVLGGEDAARGGGLYMVQARKHPRLAELIKNGTPMIRTRAHTMIVPPKMVSSLSEVVKGAPTPQVARHRSLKKGGRFC